MGVSTSAPPDSEGAFAPHPPDDQDRPETVPEVPVAGLEHETGDVEADGNVGIRSLSQKLS
mgnify:CR=1 FL=1